MTQPGENSAQEPDAELDHLLGLDPDPRLPAAARERIGAALGDAQRELGLDARLDRLLGVDEVVVPDGLADRVLAGVRSGASAKRNVVLQPVPRRPISFARKPIVGAALAAAAALAAFVGVKAIKSSASEDPAAAVHTAAIAEGEPRDDSTSRPSDELLAALPLLEDLDFLTEGIDPFEADALLLFDVDETLLMELVDLEDRGEAGDASEAKVEVKKG